MYALLMTLTALWIIGAIIGYGFGVAEGAFVAVFWFFLTAFVLTFIWAALTRRIRFR